MGGATIFVFAAAAAAKLRSWLGWRGAVHDSRRELAERSRSIMLGLVLLSFEAAGAVVEEDGGGPIGAVVAVDYLGQSRGANTIDDGATRKTHAGWCG
mmetsp:Transcript_20126/g.50372  ORF Transcript_20126/g.50372 Transcript_20126/m.50372 type:complete len:98 (+) Transcript_20126:51-344(+)